MLELLAALLGTDLGKYLGLTLAAGAALLGLRFKFRADGRAEERARAEAADTKAANDILKGAADARADSDRRNADRERLRDDDGFRRKDP